MGTRIPPAGAGVGLGTLSAGVRNRGQGRFHVPAPWKPFLPLQVLKVKSGRCRTPSGTGARRRCRAAEAGRRPFQTALAASEWQDWVDHFTIRSCDRVTAARVPKLGWVDVFATEVVVWAYEGPAECTMRALLNLVHPQTPRRPDRRLSGSTLPAGTPARAAHDGSASIRAPAGARATRLARFVPD